MPRFTLLILILVMGLIVPEITGKSLDLRLAGANSLTCGPAESPRLMNYDNQHGLAFTATFLTDSPERAYWDLPIHENLTHCAGIKLRFYCSSPAVVRQFNIYLRTGSAWQATTFTPHAEDSWQDVFIPKASFMPETTAESWKHVSMLRIAFWKGATGRTTLHLASIEFVHPNCPFAIIRSGKRTPDLREAYTYASHLNKALVLSGLHPAVIEEADSHYLTLKPYSFVYIPFPEKASIAQLTQLAAFIKRGGKAAAFHTLPPILQQQMLFPNGRFVQAHNLTGPLEGVHMQRYALPMARNFMQDSTGFVAVQQVLPPLKIAAVWKQANGQTTQWPAIIESPHGFWMTHVFRGKDLENAAATFFAMATKYMPDIRQTAAFTRYEVARRAYGDSTASSKEKSQARRLLETARTHYERGQYEATIHMTNDALNAIRNADIKPIPKNPNELRGIWITGENSLVGASWQQTVKLLVENELNTAFMLGASPIIANYQSSVTPLINAHSSLISGMKICRTNGIQVHAWLNCLSLEDAARNATQKHYLETWRREGRLQQDIRGNSLNWLCPSLNVNRALVVRLASEMAMKLQLDGIHLDFLRLPSSEACYCNNCRTAFELFLRRKTNWPTDVHVGGFDRVHWLDFRQRLLASLVREISNAVKRANPTVQVSAAVFPDLDSAINNVGQNWQYWLANGYVGFVCPMNYHDATTTFKSDLLRQIQQAGTPARILPGIGVSVNHLSQKDTQRQIYATREQKTAGFILFRLGQQEARDIIPGLLR